MQKYILYLDPKYPPYCFVNVQKDFYTLCQTSGQSLPVDLAHYLKTDSSGDFIATKWYFSYYYNKVGLLLNIDLCWGLK